MGRASDPRPPRTLVVDDPSEGPMAYCPVCLDERAWHNLPELRAWSRLHDEGHARERSAKEQHPSSDPCRCRPDPACPVHGVPARGQADGLLAPGSHNPPDARRDDEPGQLWPGP